MEKKTQSEDNSNLILDIDEHTVTIKKEKRNEPINGYGRCRSCGCKGWKPNYPKNDYCKDCGHHWSQHE